MLQIVTGIFLALHYTSDLNSAYYQIFFLIRSLLWTVFTLFSFCWSIICLSISISRSWKSYILWFILLFIFYLVFRNSSSLLLNGYSIYGLCLTFWTNGFLGSYSNYKFIISFSIFSRMDLWRILCSLSNIEEVLSLSFYLPFLLCGFLFLHLFYLHFLSSNNPLRNSTNNKIPFFPFIFLKDFFGLILILCLYFLQTHFHV